MFQGGGKPRPYYIRACQADRRIVGATLAVALALKSAPMEVSSLYPSFPPPEAAKREFVTALAS